MQNAPQLNHKSPQNVALYVAGGVGLLLLLVAASKSSSSGSSSGATVLEPNPQVAAAAATANASIQTGQQNEAVSLAQTSAAEKVQQQQLQDALDYGLHLVKSQNAQARLSSKSSVQTARIAERGQVATAKLTAAAAGYAPNAATSLATIQQEIAELLASLQPTTGVPIATNPVSAPVEYPMQGAA